jgi:hypothetical protein
MMPAAITTRFLVVDAQSALLNRVESVTLVVVAAIVATISAA